jgi:hypothetical protein
MAVAAFEVKRQQAAAAAAAAGPGPGGGPQPPAAAAAPATAPAPGAAGGGRAGGVGGAAAGPGGPGPGGGGGQALEGVAQELYRVLFFLVFSAEIMALGLLPVVGARVLGPGTEGRGLWLGAGARGRRPAPGGLRPRRRVQRHGPPRGPLTGPRAPRPPLPNTPPGLPLSVVFLSWLYAYYCFDYSWSLQGVPLPERLAFFERRWGFFAGARARTRRRLLGSQRVGQTAAGDIWPLTGQPPCPWAHALPAPRPLVPLPPPPKRLRPAVHAAHAAAAVPHRRRAAQHDVPRVCARGLRLGPRRDPRCARVGTTGQADEGGGRRGYADCCCHVASRGAPGSTPAPTAPTPSPATPSSRLSLAARLGWSAGSARRMPIFGIALRPTAAVIGALMRRLTPRAQR